MELEQRNWLLLSRRRLFTAGAGLAAAGGVSGLLSACGGNDDEEGSTGAAKAGEPRSEGTPVVGDVLDFSLRSDEWEGAFGFVSLRLHRGVVEGDDVWFIRTDASNDQFARREKLVLTPKLESLAEDGLSGELFVVDGGPAVLSSRPGRDDYTPAWRVRFVSWKGESRTLSSVADVRSAARRGELTVGDTGAVMNAAIVKWPGGQIGVDRKLRAYLEGGQLIEEPDTRAGEVKFKLHECFPNARYIVTDHSIEPAAEMTKTAFAPGLHSRPREAGATGRTNVFLDGLKGSGPMGAQPSVFDSDPGDPVWSPYWDHFTYSWVEKDRVRVLRSERQVHAARDAGELEEFPGAPDTKGEVFTVNCPVPVTAPATFRG
jgi:hypothetical protein